MILRAANLKIEVLDKRNIFNTDMVGCNSLFDKQFNSQRALQASIATTSEDLCYCFSKYSNKTYFKFLLNRFRKIVDTL